MALIQMSHTWADGSNLTVTLSGKARYPDQLSDMAGTVTRLWSDAVAQVASPADPDELEVHFAPFVAGEDEAE